MANRRAPGNRIKRQDGWYRLALQGDKENLGLRAVARGFSSRDGFNLNEGLTSAQKRKVTQAFHELQELTAQPRYVYKAKNNSKGEQKKLKQAQQIIQADTKTKFKVAFIPHVARKLKGGKYSKPRIRFSKRGVSVYERGFIKIFIPLDQERMATNAKKEITRQIKMEAPNAQRFTIQAGANEMPVLSDKSGIIKRVIELQNKYDGAKALPQGSGNAGDNPAYHSWDQWLRGLVAYEFPKASQDAIADAMNTFDDARVALQKKRRAAREKARYKAKEKRKR